MRWPAVFSVAEGWDGLAPAHPSDHGNKGKAGHAKFTFAMTTDNGSCGNAWATDTLARQSPGACETTAKHGAMVLAGVQGKFEGYLVGTVTATSFNSNATCAAGADCSSRAGFIATYFAPGATYSCDQSSNTASSTSTTPPVRSTTHRRFPRRYRHQLARKTALRHRKGSPGGLPFRLW